MKKIVLFGDSITAGEGLKNPFAKILSEKLKNYVVRNKGVSGNTIIDASNRLEKDVIRENPDTVVIFFGINDAQIRAISIEKILNNPKITNKKLLRKLRLLKLRLFGGKSKVSQEDYKSHLNNIIEIIKKKTNAEVYQITIPNISNKSFPRTNQNYDKFNSIIHEASKLYNTKLINISDIFTLDDVLFPDGKHPNEKAHLLIAEKIRSHLEK